jgi:uncharacterized membrane protein
VTLCLVLAARTALADDAASAEVKAGTGVEKHEIVGEAATFAPGTTVWAWSRVTNGPDSIKMVWKLDGQEIWAATLPVGSKKWSTMSRRTLQKAGSYEVDVTGADGASLGKVSFEIK